MLPLSIFLSFGMSSWFSCMLYVWYLGRCRVFDSLPLDCVGTQCPFLDNLCSLPRLFFDKSFSERPPASHIFNGSGIVGEEGILVKTLCSQVWLTF